MCEADACDTDVVLVLVELLDDREKVKLDLVETVRVDCSDRREADRCRTRPSYDFLVCDGARCGMAGASGDAAGAAALWCFGAA